MRFLSTLGFLLCLAAPAWGQDSAAAKPAKPKRQPDVITLAEIEQVRDQAGDAYEIIRRLRPQFLRARGANSAGNAASARMVALPRVVIDGTPGGTAESLSQISSMMIREIRYLSMADATTRFGMNFDGGAILITTR